MTVKKKAGGGSAAVAQYNCLLAFLCCVRQDGAKTDKRAGKQTTIFCT